MAGRGTSLHQRGPVKKGNKEKKKIGIKKKETKKWKANTHPGNGMQRSLPNSRGWETEGPQSKRSTKLKTLEDYLPSTHKVIVDTKEKSGEGRQGGSSCPPDPWEEKVIGETPGQAAFPWPGTFGGGKKKGVKEERLQKRKAVKGGKNAHDPQD